MRAKKKLAATVLTVVCSLSLTMTAFAASTASKAAGAYGTLTGNLSGTRSKVTSTTKVTTNPDSARLTVTMDAKNSAGSNIATLSLQKSSAGVTSYSYPWQNLPSPCTILYATQGVQDGSLYSAYAVYTNTSL